MIVVEDPPGTLSPEMEAMREVVMILQETNIESGACSPQFSLYICNTIMTFSLTFFCPFDDDPGVCIGV